MLGTVAAWFDFDWPEAERHFRYAMAQGTVSPLVRLNYAMYCLLPTGRAQEAADHYAIALKEDPLNLMARAERAVCLRSASKDAQGNEELRQIIELDDTFFFPYFMLGGNLVTDGEIDEARGLAEKGFALAPWFKPMVGLLAAVLTLTEETDRAEMLLRQHLSPERGYVDPIGPALFYLLTGDVDRMADWVEKAIEERQFAVFFFLRSQGQRTLRPTPRWPAVTRMLKLPE